MNSIILNGNQFEISNPLSINELLIIKKYSFPNIIVKINNQLIKKEAFDSTIIQFNDHVQIIHMISGG